MSIIMGLIPDEKWKNDTSQQVTLFLKKVKTKLMSCQFEEQRDAVTWLCNELNTNSTVGFDLLVQLLLKSEIIVLLGEATMTMQGPLVTSTLSCFASLAQSEQFYKQNHASYVIASILRTAHFLTLQRLGKRNEDKIVMLKSIVRTLEKIFERAASFQVSMNAICDLQEVFRFLNKLLSGESHIDRIIFSTAKILSVSLSSIRADDVVKKAEDGVLIIEVVRTTLNLMRQVIEAKNRSDGKCAFRAMAMTCAICSSGITSCSTVLDSDVNEIVSHFSKYSENLAECLISSLMKSVIPNFNKLDFDKRYDRLYNWFVSCLNGIYNLKYCNTKDLSNYLAEQGYLRILPILSTFATQNLRSEILLLLSRILTTLASVSLSASTWLGGIKQFQRFLLNSFNSLPHDPSTWLSFLNEGDDRADALLVFFYYYFLAEIADAAPYLPLIVGYVISSASLKTKRKSTTILKALWFTFCIAAICHENPSAIHSYDSATTRFFNELELVNLEQCYTHHPAVAIHCLRTTIVPDKLRLGVISLWLEGGGDIGCLLNGTVDRICMNQCLIEIIRTGSPGTVDVAMKAISETLVDKVEGIEDFINIVWEVLPRMLASRNEENVYNTKSLLKLASMFEPKDTSGIALVRSLYQLMKFVVENETDLTLVSLGIRNAYYLLQLSIGRKDVQVLTMFTKEPRLIKVLKTLAFSKEDAALSYISFHCLCLLIEQQRKCSIECEESLEIELEDLLKQLCADDCLGALQFATTIFVKKIEKPIVKLKGILSGSNCDQVIVDLYLQIHNTHAKSDLQGRNLSYTLLVGLLSHCESTNSTRLLKILCEQPWTYCLIKMTIDESRGVMDTNFMNFLSKWLFHRYSITPVSKAPNDRALCRDQFGTILDLIGNAVFCTYKKQSKKELLPKLVQIVRIFADGNIVVELLLFQEKFTENVGAELFEVYQQLTNN